VDIEILQILKSIQGDIKSMQGDIKSMKADITETNHRIGSLEKKQIKTLCFLKI